VILYYCYIVLLCLNGNNKSTSVANIATIRHNSSAVHWQSDYCCDKRITAAVYRRVFVRSYHFCADSQPVLQLGVIRLSVCLSVCHMLVLCLKAAARIKLLHRAPGAARRSVLSRCDVGITEFRHWCPQQRVKLRCSLKDLRLGISVGLYLVSGTKWYDRVSLIASYVFNRTVACDDIDRPLIIIIIIKL